MLASTLFLLVIGTQGRSTVLSVYADRFHGRKTASGAIYDRNKKTCAANAYPLGTVLTCSVGSRSVRIVVNDRTAERFAHRVDLSGAAFAALCPTYRIGKDKTGTLLRGTCKAVK